ncbi:MAG: class I SAM-dependent methyltransferase, partial [Helicobacter sp.]|nr:class I SAM-dependent methyltransferase [Helicobacter sp.]
MGFYQCDFAILDFLRSSGWLKKGMSVLEFGSQDLKEDRNGNVCGGGARISAKCVYDDYGFGRYVCIDLDGGHDCLQFDLGLSLQEHYHFNDTFDLVTVKDIGHWIFDQKMLFSNIHNALKVGGCFVWRSPIAGGFGTGCFTYLPKKLLQLGFCNHYLYKTAWVFEQLSGYGGKFGSWEQSEATYLGNSAATFLDNLQSYLERDCSWRMRPIRDGLPIIRITAVFQKLRDSPFVAPTFPYAPLHVCVCRNAQAVLHNCLPPASKGKIAIFGAKEAGKLAHAFAKAAG